MPDTTTTEKETTGPARRARSGMTVGPIALQALQGSAGNRAVTGLLDRGEDLEPDQSDESEETEDEQSSPGGGGEASPDKGAKGGKGAPGPGAKAKPVGKPWTEKEIVSLTKKKPVDVLKALSKRDTKRGVTLFKSKGDWNTLVTNLPAVKKLSETTRTAMYTIIAAEALTVPEAEALFQKRFGLLMKTGTGANSAAWTPVNIARVWHQLDQLPEGDVSENTKLAVFYATTGGGGMYAEGNKAVDLGQGNSEAYMSHTVRHEVGHGVHAMLASQVNPWLQNDIGMWYGELDDAGVDSLVADLGGWPAKFTAPDGTEKPWGDNQKLWVRHYIKTFTGSTSWSPTRVTPDPGDNVHGTAAWNAVSADLKNFCVQSKTNWFDNYVNFQKGASGNRLFLNHWYHKWFRMSDKAKKVVDITGENYTAMSEKEMFANAYAEYFADPAGKKNPKKWGGKLSGEVKDFFSTVIVNRDPYATFQKQQKKKLTSK